MLICTCNMLSAQEKEKIFYFLSGGQDHKITYHLSLEKEKKAKKLR